MALNDVNDKVYQLENAIKRVDSIKRHLSRNASDIKGEIHSCVSHNLEFLRDREVCLLSKVDEVVSQKEEALQQHQAQLNQALGVLQTGMTLMRNDSALDTQMAETIMKFNDMELSPGETPHIAFRADHMALRGCIENYGRVDANALPLPTAFDDCRKPSLSLPRHLEEYEDVDHHIFHKTVEELGKNQTAKTINVTIPKLSTRMEDWLQKRMTPVEQTYSHPSCGCPNNMMQSSSTVLDKQNSCCSTPSDTNSLNNWLSQIKHHADLEEEHDFEIVDNSRQNKDKREVSSTVSEDLKPWLFNRQEYLDSPCVAQGEKENIFHHIPEDPKFWLHQARQQFSSLEESKQVDFFQHISKEPSTWLRSRAHGKNSLPPQKEGRKENANERSVIFKDKDLKQWLVQGSQPKQTKVENVNNSCCGQGPWLQSGSPSKQVNKSPSISFQLEDICKANELCTTLSDCVCNPNCAILCQQELSGVKNPKDPTKVFSPLQLPQPNWLLPTPDPVIDYDKMDVCDQEIGDYNKSGMDESQEKNLFSHIADISSDHWIAKTSGQDSETTNLSSPSPFFKQNKEETNMWLRLTKENTSSPTHDNISKVKIDYNPPCKSLSDWLFSPKKAKAFSKEEEVMKEEASEGWSLCSSPTSFSSEQFNKDVSFATSYLQKWVL